MNQHATTLKEAFAAKYPRYPKVLAMYEAANGCPATWEGLTKPRLARFVAYMGERLARTSVRTYCAMLKSVMNLYNEEIDFPRGYEAILSPKNDVSQQTWLTDAEIGKLLLYEPKNDVERLVRNQFVLGALTGARHSDYCRFTEANIVGGSLVYISQKTHVKAEIPLCPAVRRILHENKLHGLSGRTLSDPTFNETIRAICRAAGISERVKLYQAGEFTEGEKWEYVSSHTARRSFATNLYLRGADLYSISVLMGHNSTSMTERYIVCGLRKMPDNVLAYFTQFA